MNWEETVYAALLGEAVGDALGVPVEFSSREALAAHPVTGMRGYGTHPVPAGSWSDDTSMALASLDSLQNGFDAGDMMEKFCAWQEQGAYTPTGVMFDIGMATAQALNRYRRGTPALRCGGTGEYDNGNGSLMRILPAVFYAYAAGGGDFARAVPLVDAVSCLTHAHLRSRTACLLETRLVFALLKEPSKEAVRRELSACGAWLAADPVYGAEASTYARLLTPGFETLPRDAIRSSGYVVSTLEAAVWCLLNTDHYRDCVLWAVNLGDDTDTTAAVAGGLAGLLYGLAGIPEEWQQALLHREELEALCRSFAAKQTGKEEAG